MFWWQSGCCKPPSSCGYTFINATNWQETTPPPPSASAKDPDCALWSNAPTELCFNCTSCKAGVLQDLKQDWRKVAIANIIMLVFLIATYSIGCCAFRNNRRDGGGGFFNGGRYGKQSHKFWVPWSFPKLCTQNLSSSGWILECLSEIVGSKSEL